MLTPSPAKVKQLWWHISGLDVIHPQDRVFRIRDWVRFVFLIHHVVSRRVAWLPCQLKSSRRPTRVPRPRAVSVRKGDQRGATGPVTEGGRLEPAARLQPGEPLALDHGYCSGAETNPADTGFCSMYPTMRLNSPAFRTSRSKVSSCHKAPLRPSAWFTRLAVAPFNRRVTSGKRTEGVTSKCT